LINFTGLFILLFGIFVDLSVALARYVWWFYTTFHILYLDVLGSCFHFIQVG
jgi:hypothetical protein